MKFKVGQRVKIKDDRMLCNDQEGFVKSIDSNSYGGLYPVEVHFDSDVILNFTNEGERIIDEGQVLFLLGERSADTPEGESPAPEEAYWGAMSKATSEAVRQTETDYIQSLPKVDWKARCQELEVRIEELTTQNARLAETAGQRELALANALVEVETLKQRIKELEGDLQVSKHAASYHQDRNNELTNKVLGLTAAVVVLGNRVQQ